MHKGAGVKPSTTTNKTDTAQRLLKNNQYKPPLAPNHLPSINGHQRGPNPIGMLSRSNSERGLDDPNNIGAIGISGAAVNQSSHIPRGQAKPSKLTKGELQDLQHNQNKLYSNSDLGVLGVAGVEAPRRANSMNQSNNIKPITTQGHQDLDVLENEL